MNDKTGDPRTFAIIGAAMEVHRHLGCGFAEPIYQDALEIELTLRGIPFRREGEVLVFYKEKELRNRFRRFSQIVSMQEKYMLFIFPFRLDATGGLTPPARHA